MPLKAIGAGALAGVALSVVGLAGMELATGPAGAANGDQVTQKDLKAANDRSSAAIRIGKSIQNNLGKHLTDEGVVVGLKTPPGVIRQDEGIGRGLPGEVLADDAIGEQKLSPQVRAKLGGGTAGAGPPGPAGGEGPPGPRGPSEVFYRQRKTQASIASLPGGKALELSVPAGSYIAGSGAAFLLSGAGTTTASCQLVGPNGASFSSGETLVDLSGASAGAELAFTADNTTTLELKCSQFGTLGVDIIGAWISAIRVDSATIQTTI